MPIESIVAKTFSVLDQKNDGQIDARDGTLSQAAIAALDFDGDGALHHSEIMARVAELSTTPRGRRQLEKIEKRLLRLASAQERLANTESANPLKSRMEANIAYAYGGFSQGLATEFVNDLRESTYETRRDRVETRRASVVRQWNKTAAKVQWSATAPENGIAP